MFCYPQLYPTPTACVRKIVQQQVGSPDGAGVFAARCLRFNVKPATATLPLPGAFFPGLPELDAAIEQRCQAYAT